MDKVKQKNYELEVEVSNLKEINEDLEKRNNEIEQLL